MLPVGLLLDPFLQLGAVVLKGTSRVAEHAKEASLQTRESGSTAIWATIDRLEDVVRHLKHGLVREKVRGRNGAETNGCQVRPNP